MASALSSFVFPLRSRIRFTTTPAGGRTRTLRSPLGRTNQALLQRIAANSRYRANYYSICGYRVWKRILDIAVALTALMLLLPLFLVVAAIIKRDGGPVLYWQTRIGKRGKPFKFPKFRSMVVNADKIKAQLADKNESVGGVIFKMRQDPRITPIGRIIRKYSIDELPQLWCVLKGDMTLVGPRPPLPVEVAQYTDADFRRLDVMPGLTCLWQIMGRSNLSFSQQVALDLEYISKRCVWLDLKILAQTLPAVVTARGAY
jgi:lipopolysaccharide/colanic/teichoic acid biosynthesis glycosyltransferase